MGRDRIARFPWFTAAIVLTTLRLLASKLLFGRLPQMTMGEIFIILADISALVGFLVVLEIARRAFGRVQRATWVTGALILMAIGAVMLKFWGSWPEWKALTSSAMPVLQLLQLLAQKASLLVDVETILVGLLVVLFGRRYGAGFRTHTQQIIIGLATASLAQLAIQVIWEQIARKAVAHSMAEYQHIMSVRDGLFNTNSGVYVAVVIWWIVCLWRDEPGHPVNAAADVPAAELPAEAGVVGATEKQPETAAEIQGPAVGE
jgi:hypothetical protein